MTPRHAVNIIYGVGNKKHQVFPRLRSQVARPKPMIDGTSFPKPSLQNETTQSLDVILDLGEKKKCQSKQQPTFLWLQCQWPN